MFLKSENIETFFLKQEISLLNFQKLVQLSIYSDLEDVININ